MMRGSCYLRWYCAELQALKLLDEEVSYIWTRIWQWNKVTYSRCSYEPKFCAVSWCSSNCPKWMMRSSISFLSYYITAAPRSIVILKVQLPRRIKNVLRFVTGDTKNNFVRVKCWNLAHNRVSVSVSFFFLFFLTVRDQKLQWKYTACFTLSDASSPPAVFHPNMECNIQTLDRKSLHLHA